MKKHSQCTILRTWTETRYASLEDAAAQKNGVSKTVTGQCATPLFAGDNQEAGVCRSCAKG